ncbi:hypothetical protein AB0I28_23880 [Phytomonospora sp. NPDC050363]|uniref:hypothetical protein n=1 Tax=Phytomonospora sp. NPDC050363 TaxID=3155642 RepID=UPI003404D6C5
MRLAVLFPDADSFRVGMGMELFEHRTGMWEAVREHDRVMKTSLADVLWYGVTDAGRLDAAARAAAVLTLTVGFYDVYRTRYRIPGHVFAGKGVGYLAALVAAGGLELENALRVVRGERTRRKWFRRIARDVLDVAGAEPTREPAAMRRTVGGLAPGAPLDAGALVRRLAEVRADTVLEMGPGAALTAAIRPMLPDDVVAGALDSADNAHEVLDNLNVGKFFNPMYVAERALGQIAGTKNRRGTPESTEAVNALSRRVRRLVKEGGATPEPVATVSRGDAGVIRGAVRCWIENGLAKGHRPEEVEASLRRLESECLLPVRRLGGVDEHTYKTLWHAEREDGRMEDSAMEELRRAA